MRVPSLAEKDIPVQAMASGIPEAVNTVAANKAVSFFIIIQRAGRYCASALSPCKAIVKKESFFAKGRNWIRKG